MAGFSFFYSHLLLPWDFISSKGWCVWGRRGGSVRKVQCLLPMHEVWSLNLFNLGHRKAGWHMHDIPFLGKFRRKDSWNLPPHGLVELASSVSSWRETLSPKNREWVKTAEVDLYPTHRSTHVHTPILAERCTHIHTQCENKCIIAINLLYFKSKMWAGRVAQIFRLDNWFWPLKPTW